MDSGRQMSEKGQLLPRQTEEPHPTPRASTFKTKAVIAAFVLISLLFFHTSSSPHGSCSHARKPDVAKVQQCAIDNLKADLSFLDDAKPIEPEEFLQRRDRLAQALVENDVDGFFLEPGYTFQ